MCVCVRVSNFVGSRNINNEAAQPQFRLLHQRRKIYTETLLYKKMFQTLLYLAENTYTLEVRNIIKLSLYS